MSVLQKVLAMILFAGALGSAHAVEPRRAAALPAWSIAAPDLFVHDDSGMPQDYAGYRLANATAVRYADADAGVGLKRASTAASRVAAPRHETTGMLAATPATPESTDWMLLLSGIVVAGYMARRRTRDVAG